MTNKSTKFFKHCSENLSHSKIVEKLIGENPFEAPLGYELGWLILFVSQPLQSGVDLLIIYISEPPEKINVRNKGKSASSEGNNTVTTALYPGELYLSRRVFALSKR